MVRGPGPREWIRPGRPGRPEAGARLAWAPADRSDRADLLAGSSSGAGVGSSGAGFGAAGGGSIEPIPGSVGRMLMSAMQQQPFQRAARVRVLG